MISASPRVSAFRSQVSGASAPRTRYQPTHVSAVVGPIFDSASLAAIWIAWQPDVTGWSVEPIAHNPSPIARCR